MLILKYRTESKQSMSSTLDQRESIFKSIKELRRYISLFLILLENLAIPSFNCFVG